MAKIKPNQISGLLTSSFVTTGSATLNVLTFTKGDGSTFPITIDTGSVDLSNYIQSDQTSSFTQTSSFNSFTSSYTTGSFTGSFTGDGSGLTGIVSTTDTSSLLTTASATLNEITFTKGDGSTFPITIDTGSVDLSGYVQTNQTGSFTLTSSFNSFTSSYTTGSFTGSFIGDGSGLTGIVDTTNTSSLLTTASATLNEITFTKGDGSTFPITIDTGSGGGGSTDTGSLLTTASAVSNVLTFTKGDGSTFPVTVGGIGGGDVFKVGTPVDNQIGVWTGDGTIEGNTKLTFDGFTLDITPANTTIPGALHVNGASSSASGGKVELFTSDASDTNVNNYTIQAIGEDFSIATNTGNTFIYYDWSLDTLSIEGDLTLADYGGGTITGTETYGLGVDTGGNVLEIPLGVSTSGTITTGRIPIFNTTNTLSTDVADLTLNSYILEFTPATDRSATLILNGDPGLATTSGGIIRLGLGENWNSAITSYDIKVVEDDFFINTSAENIANYTYKNAWDFSYQLILSDYVSSNYAFNEVYTNRENVVMNKSGEVFTQLPDQLSKSITVSNPEAETITIFYTSQAITIDSIESVRTAGTNVVFNIAHASTRTGTPLNVFTSDITLTSTTGQSNSTGFNDNTIPANSWVWLEIVSVSGTVTEFHTTLNYHQTI